MKRLYLQNLLYVTTFGSTSICKGEIKSDIGGLDAMKRMQPLGRISYSDSSVVEFCAVSGPQTFNCSPLLTDQLVVILKPQGKIHDSFQCTV